MSGAEEVDAKMSRRELSQLLCLKREKMNRQQQQREEKKIGVARIFHLTVSGHVFHVSTGRGYTVFSRYSGKGVLVGLLLSRTVLAEIIRLREVFGMIRF